MKLLSVRFFHASTIHFVAAWAQRLAPFDSRVASLFTLGVRQGAPPGAWRHGDLALCDGEQRSGQRRDRDRGDGDRERHDRATPTTPTTADALPTTPTTPTTPTATSSSGAGTPVQNGTVITFTTTLGQIRAGRSANTQRPGPRALHLERSERHRDDHGVLRRRVGKLENLRVGTAAAERVLVSASPSVLPPNGGTTEISARVEDTSGAGIPGVPVTFTADQGQLGVGQPFRLTPAA